MTTKETKVKYTALPQYIVDEVLSKKDAAYHEADTTAVFIDVQKYSIELKIDKLNSTEVIRYYLH